jgi:hypothetical protein
MLDAGAAAMTPRPYTRPPGRADLCRVRGASTLTGTFSPSCAARPCVFSHTSAATVTSHWLPKKACRSPHTAQVTVALVMSVMATTCRRRETNRMLPGSPNGPAPVPRRAME